MKNYHVTLALSLIPELQWDTAFSIWESIYPIIFIRKEFITINRLQLFLEGHDSTLEAVFITIYMQRCNEICSRANMKHKSQEEI